MAQLTRLTDSCIHLVTDDAATLFDPGFHTFLAGEVDLDSIGEVTRVLITHEHGDHVHPDFVKWLIDRGEDVVVYSNQAVADLLAPQDIEVVVKAPDGVTAEDVKHGKLPTGATPPNRSWTVDGVFTHPGDSREPTVSADVLALPLIAPWGTATGAVEFARKVKPQRVVPIHDFYMSESGRKWTRDLVGGILAQDGIEMLDLDWGQSLTL